MIREPHLQIHEERKYFGTRFIAPYRGMFSVVSHELKKLTQWTKEGKIGDRGVRFLRYLVIDMRGNMELEVGILGDWSTPQTGAISTGILPGGRFATLIYQGLGLAANKTLLKWISDQGFQCDSLGTERGEQFTCRYEAYLTDPLVEHRKKRWDIELAIKLKD